MILGASQFSTPNIWLVYTGCSFTLMYFAYQLLLVPTIYTDTAHCAYTNTRNERWFELCIPAVKHVNFNRSSSTMRPAKFTRSLDRRYLTVKPPWDPQTPQNSMIKLASLGKRLMGGGLTTFRGYSHMARGHFSYARSRSDGRTSQRAEEPRQALAPRY
jgi:hypothetical protein